MPPHMTQLEGTIEHVFAHRFTLRTERGVLLADVTPHGAEAVTLRAGDKVTLDGEMKPSELKVTRFTQGGTSVAIAHKKKDHGPKHHGPKHGPKHHEREDVDPALALKAVREEGFVVVGEPRRKPKHFEILGKRDKSFTELHVEFDGHIRKTKPASRDEPKWAEAMAR